MSYNKIQLFVHYVEAYNGITNLIQEQIAIDGMPDLELVNALGTLIADNPGHAATFSRQKINNHYNNAYINF